MAADQEDRFDRLGQSCVEGLELAVVRTAPAPAAGGYRTTRFLEMICHPEAGASCPPKDLCTPRQHRCAGRVHRSFASLRMTRGWGLSSLNRTPPSMTGPGNLFFDLASNYMAELQRAPLQPR